MTTGSPVGGGSGPGVADTNATCVPSGDHDRSSPVDGVGLLVWDTPAMCLIADPSARATNSPASSSFQPRNATDFPSGDQRGLNAAPLSPESGRDSPLAASAIQIRGYGAPGWSLLTTVYATRAPSRDNCTSATDRNL